jgi:hypothetical protein
MWERWIVKLVGGGEVDRKVCRCGRGKIMRLVVTGKVE